MKARHWHHTNYVRYGKEIPWVDLVPVSVPGHWLIHGICGGSVWMTKAVTRQNRIARSLPLTWVWHYPNPVQRLAHLWCRTPVLGKLLMTGYLLYFWVLG